MYKYIYVYIYLLHTQRRQSTAQQAPKECLCREQGCRCQSQRKTALLDHARMQGLKQQGFLLLSVFPKEVERSNSLCYGENDCACASYRCACLSTVIQVPYNHPAWRTYDEFEIWTILDYLKDSMCLHPLELPSLPPWHLAPLVKPVVQVLLKNVPSVARWKPLIRKRQDQSVLKRSAFWNKVHLNSDRMILNL